MVIASLLNRTLVLPPLYLGHAGILSWKPERDLVWAIRSVEKTNFNRLFPSEIGQNIYNPKLEKYMHADNYVSIIPWDAIYDFRKLSGYYRTISAANFVKLRLLEHADDIWKVRDCERYCFKAVDKLPYVIQKLVFDNLHNDPTFKNFNYSGFRGNRWFVVRTTLCTQSAPPYDRVYRHVMSGYVSQKNGELSPDLTSVNEYLVSQESSTWSKSELLKVPKCKSILRSLTNFLPPTDPYESIMEEGQVTSLLVLPMLKAAHLINLSAISSYTKFEQVTQLSNPKLIVFGSLFGKDRLSLIGQDAKKKKSMVEKSLIYQNPILEAIVVCIVEGLGGDGRYVAVHIRAGDGHFQDRVKSTVERAVQVLRKWQKSENFDLVFLATDFRNPSSSPLFDPLFSSFPQVKTLFDFQCLDKLSELDKWRLEELNRQNNCGYSLKDNEMSPIFDYLDSFDTNPDGMNPNKLIHSFEQDPPQHLISSNSRPINTAISRYASHWLPFLDQMTASRAVGFIGTVSSTFSDYIVRLHSHQRLERPLLVELV